MKVTFKNIIILLLVGLMLLGVIMPIFAESDVPFTDETYWNNTCEGFGYNENKDDCYAYKQFLLEKIKDSNSSLEQVKVDLATVREDIKKYMTEIDGYSSEIKALEADAKAMQASIDAAQIEIDRLEVLIAERIKNIEEKEERVKEYIALSQSQFRVNGYIEFVMGAKDFSDIVMRMEGLNRIKVFNEALIAELKEERVALEEDKLKVEDQKELMVIEKSILDEQVIYTASLKKASEDLMAQLQKLELEYEAAAANINAKVAMDKKQMDSLKEKIAVIPSSGAWTNPIRGSYSVVNTGWYYHSGGVSGPHNGSDLGVSRGTPIVAVANGLVVANKGGCGEGNYGCNGSYGNYVNLIVEVEGTIYGVLYAHLQNGSFQAAVNTTVSAGTTLALSGNTGWSTGPHLHIEIIRLPQSTIVDAYEEWDGTMWFGTGSASNPGRRICDWGAGAPCRIDPAKIFGY